jgi:hypothetical protein
VRRLIVGLVLAAMALLATATLATANHGESQKNQGPKLDLVAGTGTRLGDGDMIHVNAVNDNPSDPQDARGHFLIRGELLGTPFTLQGKVVCLNVDGPMAVVGGEVTKATFPNVTPGTELDIEIKDGGEPGTADFVYWDFGSDNCGFDFEQVPLIRGNYIVHDQTTNLVVQSLQLQIDEFEAAAGPH